MRTTKRHERQWAKLGRSVLVFTKAKNTDNDAISAEYRQAHQTISKEEDEVEEEEEQGGEGEEVRIHTLTPFPSLSTCNRSRTMGCL